MVVVAAIIPCVSFMLATAQHGVCAALLSSNYLSVVSDAFFFLMQRQLRGTLADMHVGFAAALHLLCWLAGGARHAGRQAAGHHCSPARQ